jgi:hypothetical protein
VIGWLNTELWQPMWPNMFAPSAITLAAIVIAHYKAKWHRERMHDAMKAHVTATHAATESR